MELKLCPGEKCYYYGHASDKYPRKCYYGEPMCWRGFLDQLWAIIKLVIKVRMSKR